MCRKRTNHVEHIELQLFWIIRRGKLFFQRSNLSLHTMGIAIGISGAAQEILASVEAVMLYYEKANERADTAAGE